MSKTVRTIHMCLSVRGALRWPPKEFRNACRWVKKADGSKFTPGELREALMDKLAQGFEVVPMGKCDNFDPKKGCRGHVHKAEAPG